MTTGEADRELLLKFFDYEIRRMEFYDTQRERMTGLLFTVSSGLIALAKFQNDAGKSDATMGWFLFVIGLYGVAFSAKYYLRAREHRFRSKAIEKVLDLRFGGMTILAMRESATAEAREIDRKFWFRIIDSGDKLNLFWALLPAVISVFGIVLIF